MSHAIQRSFLPVLARVVRIAVAGGLLGSLAAAAHAAGIDGGMIASTLRKSGTEMPGGVYRIGLPRTDLHVTLDGVELKPTLALGSWLVFRSDGNEAMVMGDLVLTETEIPPVNDQAGGGRHRNHGATQSPSAGPAGNFLHA